VTSPTRRHGRIDGLKVRVIDDSAASDAELVRALRTLARMMVRNHEHAGHHLAIDSASVSSSDLTVSRRARRVDSDEAA